ncbi:MAG TPA: T9SS type A sorting domain-containing protein [Cyclobacteriaceae bacterium]
MLKKLFFVCAMVLVAQFTSTKVMAQYDCSAPSGGPYTFFNKCIGAPSPYNDPNDYSISIGNGVTLTINGNINITGTLTINLVGATSKLVIATGSTVIAGNLVLTGSATGKQVEVQSGAVLDVTGNIDFGGLPIEISGDGTVDAGTISNSGSVTCSDPCTTTFLGGATTLPVDLLYFKALGGKEEVALSWATASELNFDYFIVERSQNGKFFEELTQIKGNGTTSEQHDYSYNDRYPLIGNSYYRLTSVDFDGFREVFNVVAVNYTGEKSARVYPNPASGGRLNIELTFTPTEEHTITITDLNGAEKMSNKLLSKQASYQVNLDPGTYILEISGPDFSKVMRVVVR